LLRPLAGHPLLAEHLIHLWKLLALEREDGGVQ
jgi:hypothetical protein